MATHIRCIFWGLLLVILDFNINQFDLLPDFIGYILVAVGSHGLVVASRHFIVARNSCWALVVLSLVELLMQGDVGILLEIIHLAANCIMMWFLLGGFMGIAITYNRQGLAEKASHRRIAYVVLMCTASLLGLIAYEVRDIAALVAIAIVVAMLVILVMILHLIHQVKRVTLEDSNIHPQ